MKRKDKAASRFAIWRFSLASVAAWSEDKRELDNMQGQNFGIFGIFGILFFLGVFLDFGDFGNI